MIAIKRSVCFATIGFIYGIISGLYFKSIAFYFCAASLITLNLILIIFVKKYENICKALVIFLILSVVSYTYILILEKGFDKIQEEHLRLDAIIVSDCVDNGYTLKYEVKLLKSNKKMLMYIKKNGENKNLSYGDLVKIDGEIKKAQGARNSGGFDYNMYLKTKKIYGIIYANKIDIIKKENKISIINIVQKKMKDKIKKSLNKDEGDLLTAILIGDKSDLDENLITYFRDSNLSHLLAVSGTHISYVILGLTYAVEKSKIGKIRGKIFIIIFLMFFMALTNFTPSVIRAVITTSLTLIASLIFRKADIYNNIALSAFIILFVNPYSILDIGFQLSFARYSRNSNVCSIF